MAITCPKCAAHNQDAAKFCKACGCDLRVAAQPAALAPTPTSALPPAPALVPAPQAVPQQNCPQCSAPNHTSAKFCKSCGVSMLVTAPAMPPPPVVAKQPEPAPASTPLPPSASLPPLTPSPSLTPSQPLPPSPPSPPPFLARPVNAPSPQPSKMAAAMPFEPQKTASKPMGQWVALGAVCLALASAGYLWVSRTKAPASDAVAAGPAPTPIAPPAPAPAPAPVAAAPEPSKPAAQTVVITESAAQAGIVIDKPKPVVPKPALPKPADKPAPVAAKPVPARAEAATAPTPPREAQAPAAPAAPVQSSGPSSPKEACGSRIFLALSNCMNNQCQTSQFAKHPQCVQLRQEEKERLDRASNASSDR
jgi:hypothetical protein